MAERKAVNKYYPPDWDPSKGSANKRTGSHHLRDRARKLDKGILVVRFEMPFNIWCSECKNHIATGVRYNAEKSKVGNYYTTPIYKFKMKCHLCDNFFEIQTDPAKFDYAILSGATKRARPSEIDGDDQIVIDEEESKRRLTDAMFRLEKKTEDEMKREESLPNILDIKKWRSRWEDNFTANSIVRSQYRKRRKNLEASRIEDKELLKRMSLKIDLAQSSPSDRAKARELLRERRSDRIRDAEALSKQRILNSSIQTSTIKLEKSTPRQSASSSQSLGVRVKRDPHRRA